MFAAILSPKAVLLILFCGYLSRLCVTFAPKPLHAFFEAGDALFERWVRAKETNDRLCVGDLHRLKSWLLGTGVMDLSGAL